MSIHVYAIFCFELFIDFLTVDQVRIELNNRSYTVGGSTKVGDEGRISEPVRFCDDHLGDVVLSSQSLNKQSCIADVAVAQDGIRIGLLECQNLSAQVGSIAGVVHRGNQVEAEFILEQFDATDQFLTDCSAVSEDCDLLNLFTGLFGGVFQILQHIPHIHAVQRAQAEEILISLVIRVGQHVQRGDGGDHGDLVDRANLGHNVGHNGHMASHDDVHMLLVDQTLCFGLTGLWIAGVVALDDFQHLAVYAAFGIDLIHSKIDATQNVFADSCVAAAHGIDGTDFDGISLSKGDPGYHRQEHRKDAQKSNQLFHDVFFLLIHDVFLFLL